MMSHLVKLVHSGVGHALSLKPILVGNDFKLFLRIDLKNWRDISEVIGVGCIKDLVLRVSCKSCHGIIKVTQEMSSVLDCFHQALDLVVH